MATITISAAETGQVVLNKVFTLADADMDAMVAAYQADANISIGGTATRAQVFNFIIQGWASQIKLKIQIYQTVPAITPSPIAII